MYICYTKKYEKLTRHCFLKDDIGKNVLLKDKLSPWNFLYKGDIRSCVK